MDDGVSMFLTVVAERKLEVMNFLQQPKTAPKERRYPIFVALERGLNVSMKANIQPAVIESQI